MGYMAYPENGEPAVNPNRNTTRRMGGKKTMEIAVECTEGRKIWPNAPFFAPGRARKRRWIATRFHRRLVLWFALGAVLIFGNSGLFFFVAPWIFGLSLSASVAVLVLFFSFVFHHEINRAEKLREKGGKDFLIICGC